MTIIEEATMKSIQGIYKKSPDLNDVTLRDLFAMSALSGFCANEKLNHHSEIELSKFSYDFADAMLEERKSRS